MSDDLPELKDGERVGVVNDTDLPDNIVEEAVETFWVGSHEVAWGDSNTFQTVANEGSAFARKKFDTPGNVFDEIELARQMADRDDDVSAAIGWMVAAAYEGGMRNTHSDEKTVGLFNAVAREANLDHVLTEMYREYLISAQVNTLQLFTRKTLDYQAFASEEMQSELISTPLVGVLPAENVWVLGNDIFGTGELAYVPKSEALRRWLTEFFDKNTSAGRKAEMARKDRITAAMFSGYRNIDPSAEETSSLNLWADPRVWLLNPRMVHRTTGPKGAAKYPTPFLTRNFGLLEAKRLLNVLDWTLLEGGASYIVVAKKGTDEKPAKPKEIRNLEQAVRMSTKSGVMVGDHRLSFEVITPDLETLLNPAKRRLLGRKLVMSMLRTPEFSTEEPGGAGIEAEQEEQARVIGVDRNLIKRHLEARVYGETVKRNASKFPKGAPTIWHPKIVLAGTSYFNDIVIKMIDRGNISRETATAIAGFDFEAELQQRQRELDSGVDEVMLPATVPHSSPDVGPQDNGGGRPPGSGTGEGGDPARPKQQINQNPGETIRAVHEEGQIIKVGDATQALLEEYPQAEIGRVHRTEREAIEGGEPTQIGPKLIIPVRLPYEADGEVAVNLDDGIRLITAKRKRDKAVVTRAVCFRDNIDMQAAVERVERWGLKVSDPS